MTAAAAGWVAATASVRGASHERSGKPNQDAVRVVEVSGPTSGLVAAVCDGHGGDRYVRSDVGSRLGVEVACSIGRRALETLGSLPSADAVESHLAREVARSIVEQWRRRVLDDVERRPFSRAEEERAGAPLAPDPLIAYGCTLVMALVAPSWVGLLQIGDGDVTVVRGASASSPVPGDDRLVGGETTSLCLPTAAADARVAVIGDPLPDLIILTSDGYANSFASPTWRTEVGVDLRDHVNRIGVDGVEQRLPSWLSDSAVAAGDDVSMALIHRIGASSGPVPIPAEPAAARSTAGGTPWRTFLLVGAAAILGVGAGWFVADAIDSGSVESTDEVIEATLTTTATTDAETTEPSTGPAPPDVSRTTTPTSEPEVADLPTLGDRDQVHLLIGEETGVVLAFDPSSPNEPKARSYGWVAMSSNRDPSVPERWEFDNGSVYFDNEPKGEAVAAVWPFFSEYVWVVEVWAVERGERTLVAYDVETGDEAGRSQIVDFSDPAGDEPAQSSPPSGVSPGTIPNPTTTPPRGAPSATENP